MKFHGRGAVAADGLPYVNGWDVLCVRDGSVWRAVVAHRDGSGVLGEGVEASTPTGAQRLAVAVAHAEAAGAGAWNLAEDELHDLGVLMAHTLPAATPMQALRQWWYALASGDPGCLFAAQLAETPGAVLNSAPLAVPARHAQEFGALRRYLNAAHALTLPDRSDLDRKFYRHTMGTTWQAERARLLGREWPEAPQLAAGERDDLHGLLTAGLALAQQLGDAGDVRARTLLTELCGVAGALLDDL